MSYPAYPSYQNSEIKWLGQLPDHWSVTALKRNFQICGGSTPDPDPKNWDGEISWYTPADLSGLETFQLGASKRTISKAGLVSSGCALLPEGSIVVSTRAPIGSLGITTTSGCTNQGCKGLVPASHISSLYYAYLLVTGKAELNSRGRGSTFTEISGEELGVIRVPVPPHAEQTQIARFLDHQTARIDALIAEQQRLIELLKEKRQAVISHAVTKGLAPDVAMKDSGVEWLGMVPAHWKMTRAKMVADIFIPQRNRPELNESGDGYSWVTMEDMQRDYIEKTDKFVSREAAANAGSRVINKGAVVASCVGNFGIASVLCTDAIINQQLQAYIPKTISAFYLKELITCSKAYFDLVGTAATIVYVNQEGFANLPVPLPPLDEQLEIEAQLEKNKGDFDDALSRGLDLIALLQERRSALISAAVTGKIDVRDWEPPVSETFPQSTVSEETTA